MGQAPRASPVMRHPRDLDEGDIRAFLEDLAVRGRVAASTQNQALNALVFLFRHVLEREVGDIGLFTRARAPKRLPTVLSRSEVSRVLAAMHGTTGLVARLLYRCGLRIQEAVTLRVMDLDFEYGVLHIKDAKGAKDRDTMLPESLRIPLDGPEGRTPGVDLGGGGEAGHVPRVPP